MKSDSEISEVLGLVYAAALDPQCWSEAVWTIARTVQSHVPMMWLLETEAPLPDLPGNAIVSSIDDSDYHLLMTEYIPHTPEIHILGKSCYQKFRSLEDLGLHEIYQRTRLHNEFDLRYDISHSAMCTFPVQSSKFSGLTFHRSSKAGQFTSSEKSYLDSLMLHIQRSMRMSEKLHACEVSEKNLRSALDSTNLAFMELTLEGQVRWANEAMYSLIQDGQIGVRHGRVFLPKDEESSELMMRIFQCGRFSCSTNMNSRGPTIAVSRPGRTPLAVELVPLVETHPFRSHGVLLVASDPETTRGCNLTWLRQAFRLTPTETKLAASLATGRSLSETSEYLKIGIGTARNHLKRVFRKTNVSSQSRLIWLIRRTSATQ